MPSSSSSYSKKGLQGPRSQTLKISPENMINKKQPISSIVQQRRGNYHKSPVVVYLRSPRVVHAKPHEFMSIVQKLTGKSLSPAAFKTELDSSQVRSNSVEIGLCL